MTAATAERPRRLRLTRPEPTEAQAMQAVRTALHYHPAVAWVARVNSGSAWLRGKDGRDRPVKFHDIDGCSDLLGQLRGSGRLLAVEVKRPSTRGDATDAQLAFLQRVRNAGGVAFVAAAADEAIRELNAALERKFE